MKRSSKIYRGKDKFPGGMSDWSLDYEGFEPSEEGLREALCVLSNGYFGTRGAANEASASRVSYPGTYIAGVYNKLATNVAGRKIYNEDLVNCPNWLPVTFRLSGGRWVSFENSKIMSDRRRLDLYGGVLYRSTVFSDSGGREIKVSSERIVHMAHPHIGAIKYVIEPLDYEGPLYIRSALDGTVKNTGVPRYRGLRSDHLRGVREGGLPDGVTYLSVRTSHSDIQIAQAFKTALYADGKRVRPEKQVLKKRKKFVCREAAINAEKGASYRLDKITAIYTSRDRGVKDPLRPALSAVRKAPWFDTLKKSHQKAWNGIWDECGFRVKSEGEAGKIVNFHAFHLLQTATRHNSRIDAALPARGLHGEAYRGHIFWDEMFVMPLYDHQAPVVSKALLKYRYNRLGKAREYAGENGYEGAMFPWQSGSTGEEETQVVHLNPMSGKWGPDLSRNQRHISFSIAYNIWKFSERTGDEGFMDRYGSEMFLSIAKFSASLAEFSEKDSKYHTHRLMGPDEFHEKMPLSDGPGYTDNAYSNVFIIWILRNALKLLESLPARKKRLIMKKAGVRPDDPARWEDITRRMNLIVNEDGVISQFDGYFGLKELNWEHYRNKYGDIHRMDRILKAEGKSPNAYKAAKQADVLMMFYVFSVREIKDIFELAGCRFTKDMLEANYDYYLRRTSHGSTLSKVVHCYLAHMMGREKESWKWYLDVLGSDIHDVQGGTTPEGIHVGVMGGSIDIIIRAFAGIGTSDGIMEISPRLPRRMGKLEFKLLYHERKILFSVEAGHFTVELLNTAGKNGILPVSIYGSRKELLPGKKYKFAVSPMGREGAMARKKVLVVEGEITLGERLADRLQKEDIQARSVSGGAEAMDILKGEWFDLIILSVKLQGEMDGFQFMRAVKEDKGLSKVPVVMGSDKPGMKDIFKKIGAADFFVKPYSISALIKKVKELLA